MNRPYERSDEERKGIPDAGLCAVCAHVKRIPSLTGQTFYMCRLAKTEPSLLKYPILPVTACPGFLRKDS